MCIRDSAEALRTLGDSFREHIARLTGEIYGLAGEQFNINAPKQLSELLFVKMGLPAPKKKGKAFSTDAEVLENLAQDFPICATILEYRKYKKLASTYIRCV